jgi:hypothetical protein
MAANGRKLPQCRSNGNNGNQPKIGKLADGKMAGSSQQASNMASRKMTAAMATSRTYGKATSNDEQQQNGNCNRRIYFAFCLLPMVVVCLSVDSCCCLVNYNN